MQHGFRLVIGGVGGRDKSGAQPFGSLLQEIVAGGPGGCLPAVALLSCEQRNVDSGHFERQA